MQVRGAKGGRGGEGQEVLWGERIVTEGAAESKLLYTNMQ